MAGSRTAAGGA